MNLKKKFTLTFLLFALIEGAFSQLNQPYRFEKELKAHDNIFRVISLKKEGLAMIRSLQVEEQGRKKWELEILDTTLTKVWSTEIILDLRLILVENRYSLNHLFLLFREGDFEPYGYYLMEIRLHEKALLNHHIKFDVNFKMSHFVVTGASVVFGGNLNNGPAVFLYDQTTESPKILSGLFNSGGILLDIRENHNQSFNVLLSESLRKGKKRLLHRTFDRTGNLVFADTIGIDDRYTVLSGITSSLERDELIIVGTFTNGNPQSAATGFFSVMADPFKAQQVVYTDFPSLQHFLDYMPLKKAVDIELKAREQKAHDRFSNYKVEVILHRIEERPDGFYLFSETYEILPDYNTPSKRTSPGSMTYGVGQPYETNISNWRRTYGSIITLKADAIMLEGIVVAFDSHGHPIKDLGLKLGEIRLAVLDQTSDFLITKNGPVIASKKVGNILFQMETTDSTKLYSNQWSKVRLGSENDTWLDEAPIGNTRFWYDHHFYVWGVQTIKNPSLKGSRNRDVFYINRINVK